MRRITLALVLCLAACATAPPERSYYLLRAEVPGDLAPAENGALLGVGTVSIAPYLDRSGVIVQVGDHRVREARYHLWAEPLDRGIRAYLSDRIAASLGRTLNNGPNGVDRWDYRLDVSIEEFHGTLNGEARLVAQWSLIDTARDKLVASQRLVRTKAQTVDGYSGLVEAHAALLDELATEIVTALSRVGAV
jgi:uncharacterized lipoprotein YmbA